MEDIGNVKLQILGEVRNTKSPFLIEVKSFKNEFLQSCAKHSPRKQVHANSMSEISGRFIPFKRANIVSKEQLRNKDKTISSLIDQLSKDSEVIQTTIINPKDNNLFPRKKIEKK